MPTRPSAAPIPSVGVVVSQLGAGGAERQTIELLRGLRHSPWRPRVVVCLSEELHPFQEHLHQLGYAVEVLPRAASFDPRRLRRLRSTLRRHGIGLVHAVHLLASGYAFLATRGPGMPPVLPTVRGTVVEPGPLRSLVYRWMLRSCPRVLVNSHRGAAFLERRFAVPAGRIAVVPNGIDFGAVRGASSAGDLRASLGLPAGAPLLVYVGKNSTVKNVPRFMNAWQEVSGRWPEAHALLVGRGLGEEGRRTLLGERPPHRTHFLGPRNDVPSVLSQADVLVLTSNSEGAPNVVLEALAVGTPVVSTDVGDVPRMVVHERTGFVVPTADALELAAAVGRVLAHRQEFRRAVLDDNSRLERAYSMDAMIAGTIALWQEVAR